VQKLQSKQKKLLGLTMMQQRIKDILKSHQGINYGFVAIENFVFNKDFHDSCASNRCGKYGTNWACPPGAGTFEELRSKISNFSHGLVIQTTWEIKDSFDIEGMLESGRQHNAIFREVAGKVTPMLSGKPLVLSAGACDLCESCSYILKRPCRKPEAAIGSLEAYGVDVGALLDTCGLQYRKDVKTLSYVGVIMFNQP